MRFVEDDEVVPEQDPARLILVDAAEQGEEERVVQDDDVSGEDALAGFTTGAAYASFAESRVGRLAPGYWADFILVDTDPLLASPSEIRATKVSETWVGGKRAWAVKPAN